jgi:hypothetical protein
MYLGYAGLTDAGRTPADLPNSIAFTREQSSRVNAMLDGPKRLLGWRRRELGRLATGRKEVKASECHDKVSEAADQGASKAAH